MTNINNTGLFQVNNFLKEKILACTLKYIFCLKSIKRLLYLSNLFLFILT